MRSGNKVPTFKMMGSSPLTMPGHGAPPNHKHDGDNWTAQEVTTDKDGTKRITNSSGTVGKKGTTTTNPGKTTTTKPEASTTPSTEKNTPGTPPKVYPDDDKVHGKACSAAYIAKHGNSACEGYKKKKEEGALPEKKKTEPKTTTTKPVTTTTKPVTTTTPDTPDTREDEVLSAGPGKGAVTGDVNFNTAKKKGPVRKFFDRVKEGRQIKKNGDKKCGPKDDCGAYG